MVWMSESGLEQAKRLADELAALDKIAEEASRAYNRLWAFIEATGAQKARILEQCNHGVVGKFPHGRSALCAVCGESFPWVPSLYRPAEPDEVEGWVGQYSPPVEQWFVWEGDDRE